LGIQEEAERLASDVRERDGHGRRRALLQLERLGYRVTLDPVLSMAGGRHHLDKPSAYTLTRPGDEERTEYVRKGHPELKINTDWIGHAKPGPWYGRYYADWDAAHPGAWVRGELVPGGFYGGNWGGSTLSWDANWFSKHGAKMPKGVHYITPGRSRTRLTEKLNPSDTGVMRLQFRDD
jgi:hypothetical protein